MSKSCDNCGKQPHCPWTNTNYCIEWIDKDVSYNTTLSIELNDNKGAK